MEDGVDDERQNEDQDSKMESWQKTDARSSRQHLTVRACLIQHVWLNLDKQDRKEDVGQGWQKKNTRKKKRNEQEPRCRASFSTHAPMFATANQLYLDLFSGQSPFVSRLSPLSPLFWSGPRPTWHGSMH
jgi:hypothetical protein